MDRLRRGETLPLCGERAQEGEGLPGARAVRGLAPRAAAPGQRRTSLAPGGVIYTQRELDRPATRSRVPRPLFTVREQTQTEQEGSSPRVLAHVPARDEDGLADQEQAMRKTWIALLALAS